MTENAESTHTRLFAMAGSERYQDRAEAGRRLASLAGDPAVDEVLGSLLLDPTDTFVTLETTKALLAERDKQGVRLVARAWAVCDDDTGNELGDGVAHEVATGQNVSAVRDLFRALLTDSDQDVRLGATGILDWLLNT